MARTDWFREVEEDIRKTDELLEDERRSAAECRTETSMPFEQWFAELKQVAVKDFGFTPESAETLHADSWRDYFDAGQSPAEAMSEDMSYA
jgi:hypothetical protein